MFENWLPTCLCVSCFLHKDLLLSHDTYRTQAVLSQEQFCPITTVSFVFKFKPPNFSNTYLKPSLKDQGLTSRPQGKSKSADRICTFIIVRNQEFIQTVVSEFFEEVFTDGQD
jgi:hypothetical protein